MPKCFDCRHFDFDRMVCFYRNSPEVSVGRCRRDPERITGNLTYGISTACASFEPYTVRYQPWDALLSDKKGLIVIEAVQPDYYPRVYRVWTVHHGGFSISELEIERDGYKLIWREKEKTDGKED